MLFEILKKDLMKRKGINFILFLFITIATVFLASSLNNIMVIGSAVNDYMTFAHVPDVNIIMNSHKDIDRINQWLDEKVNQGEIKDYGYNTFLEISDKSVLIQRDGEEYSFDNQGVSLFLSTDNIEYCQVFNRDNEKIHLNDGEIALSIAMMEKANLEIGDHLLIHQNGVEKDLVIQEVVKDAAFGNEMVGMTRFMLSENDFHDLQGVSSELGLYYIMSDLGTKISDDMNDQGFVGIMNTITSDIYKLVYSFDMIMASLLILVGVCLILIALLVLRFTLVFSLEEEYQEIGVLKAIGLRDYTIKKIYLMKYLFIVVLGATLGTLLSIPVSQKMIDSVSQNMVMNNQNMNILIHVLCALFIIALILIFCYLCTRKLNKVSAITAIRGGYTGERFDQGKGIQLSRFSRLPVPMYLGLNDILSHMTRYIVLMIAFSLSFILITIPLNTLNTMQSEEMVNRFCIDPHSSIYVRKIESHEEKLNNSQSLMNAVKRVETEMLDKGYQVKTTASPIYFINYIGENNSKKANIMSIQMLGEKRDFLQYSEGKAPLLDNEIAFSQEIMKEQSWVIGDYVTALINGEEKQMIITGVYSDYMQLGKSARLNPVVNCEKEVMFDYWAIMVDILDNQLSQEELAQKLQVEFPDYEWVSAQALIDQNVGGIQGVLSDLVVPMTLLLGAVIMLITLLMEKLFITREKGEIAMMKSIGFLQSTIRYWQLSRMICVVIVSMIVAIPLSLLSNIFLLKPIFAIMGASLTIQVNPLEVYILYPGILSIGIIIATALATNGLKTISIREMNNLE